MASRPKTQPNAARRGRPLTVSRPELLHEGSDRAFRQLIHHTLAFAAQCQEIRNGFGNQIGLSGSQYTILITIDHNCDREGGIGVNQVAEQLHLSGAFVTMEINKLVAKELVEKTVNPEDRRRVLLRSTAKGGELLAKLSAIQRPVNDVLFDCLSHKEFHTLRELMAKLILSGERSLNLLNYLEGGGGAQKRA